MTNVVRLNGENFFNEYENTRLKFLRQLHGLEIMRFGYETMMIRDGDDFDTPSDPLELMLEEVNKTHALIVSQREHLGLSNNEEDLCFDIHAHLNDDVKELVALAE